MNSSADYLNSKATTPFINNISYSYSQKFLNQMNKKKSHRSIKVNNSISNHECTNNEEPNDIKYINRSKDCSKPIEIQTSESKINNKESLNKIIDNAPIKSDPNEIQNRLKFLNLDKYEEEEKTKFQNLLMETNYDLSISINLLIKERIELENDLKTTRKAQQKLNSEKEAIEELNESLQMRIENAKKTNSSLRKSNFSFRDLERVKRATVTMYNKLFND